MKILVWGIGGNTKAIGWQFKENMEILAYIDSNAVPNMIFKPVITDACKVNEKNGEMAAIRDFNKNYPNTVQENIRILEDYLNFLLQRKVKPILLVMPVSKYYLHSVPTKKKEEFNIIIRHFIEVYGERIQVLVFFNMELEDQYFGDTSHFNTTGAKYFTTNYLDKKIRFAGR